MILIITLFLCVFLSYFRTAATSGLSKVHHQECHSIQLICFFSISELLFSFKTCIVLLDSVLVLLFFISLVPSSFRWCVTMLILNPFIIIQFSQTLVLNWKGVGI